ncbi:(Fe-S)-binding protein [Bacteroidia bacterium]|nr:(Fe-S)-binding protein [Bacteroidia bacterium]
MQKMKEKIRTLVLSLGADICGFAHIDRFDNAPKGFNPADIFPDCRSVIAFGIALPKGLAGINPRLVYGYFNSFTFPETDKIALQTAKRMEEDYPCTAVPVPCDSPYEYWDAENMEGRGLISMNHTAVAAGLGAIGKSSLLLNPRYGNMLTLGALLTDLDLPSDPVSENICKDNCRKCMDNCPVGAIENGRVNQKLCRNNTYGKTQRGFDTVDCNRCRTVCPMNYGDCKLSDSGIGSL